MKDPILITIYIKGKRKTVGLIVDNVFTKRVKESKHLFVKLDAWGVDYNAFFNSIKPNANIMIVEDTENKKWYYTTPKTFENKSEVRRYQKKDKDGKLLEEHGAQMFLSRRYWVCKGDPLSTERIKELISKRLNN